MIPELPKPIAEYFAAANTDDADRIAACFAADAKVNDEKQDFVGRPAIRQWAIDGHKKYSFQSEPFARQGGDEAPIVRAHVTGDFPGNPVDLTNRFTLADGALATLSMSIGRAEPRSRDCAQSFMPTTEVAPEPRARFERHRGTYE
jgi:hypothetical protein